MPDNRAFPLTGEHPRTALHTGLRRVGGLVAGLGVALTGLGLLAPAAGAATRSHVPMGSVDSVTVNANRTVTLRGWEADADAPGRTGQLDILVDGHRVARASTGLTRRDVVRTHPVAGFHSGFRAVTPQLSAGRHQLCVRALNRGAGHVNPMLRCVSVRIVAPNTGATVLSVARSFVGHVRYRTGGSTPAAGFDCSGLTQYTYRRVGRIIPRLAQAQARVFHRIPRSQARAGDLVFFHSGATVYHVGVYAGGNMMVAAADYGYGIRYQTIWSTAVTFGTILH